MGVYYLGTPHWALGLQSTPHPCRREHQCSPQLPTRPWRHPRQWAGTTFRALHPLKLDWGHLWENGLPRWLRGKESACNSGDRGSIPGSGRSPGGGNGHPFQYSCLENPKDRGISWVTVCGIAKSRTLLSDFLSLSNRRYHCMAKAENIWVIDCIATLIKNNVQ